MALGCDIRTEKKRVDTIYLVRIKKVGVNNINIKLWIKKKY